MTVSQTGAPFRRFGASALSEYTGPTGKRSAVKVARSVWNGGKAAKPYLSLPSALAPRFPRFELFFIHDPVRDRIARRDAGICGIGGFVLAGQPAFGILGRKGNKVNHGYSPSVI
jgi:hypothetical protein